MGNKGSNVTETDSSTTSTVAPNAQAMKAYKDLIARATGVSNTPFEGYTGESVAGITNQQREGFANVAGAMASLTPDQIAEYYDPWEQSVIDATMRDFDVQNQRAATSTRGQAASQGALGGNRVGVAEALTEESQRRTQDPIIARLRSEGYTRAVDTAQEEQERRLRGAGAQIGAGTLEQQTQQAMDTQARADYFQEQGYDFNTAQWLAGIVTGTGPLMGSTTTGSGTSTTQGPTPNPWMQIAGLGLAGAGTFMREDGGRIAGFAGGGGPMGGGVMDVTGGGIGWIPKVDLRPAKLLEAAPFKAPEHAKLPAQADPLAGMGKNLGTVGKSLWDKYGPNKVDDPLANYSPAQDTSNPNYGVGPEPSAFYGAEGPTFAEGMQGTSGGFSFPNIFAARGGGVHRRGYQTGGMPVMAGFGGSPLRDRNEVIDLSDLPPINEGTPTTFADREADANALKMSARDYVPDPVVASNLEVVGEQPITGPRGVQTISYKRPEAPGASHGDIVNNAIKIKKGIAGGTPVPLAVSGVLPSGVSSYGAMEEGDVEASSRGRRPIAALGVAAGTTPGATGGMGGFNPLNLSDEARQGLISMGLAMMSNRRGGPGSFLSGVGEAGAAGMETYASAKAATAASAALARKEAFEREKFEAPYSRMTKAQEAEAGQKPWRTVVGPDGKPRLEPTPGGPYDLKTIKDQAAAKLPEGLDLTADALDAAAKNYRLTGKLPPNMGRGMQGDAKKIAIINAATQLEKEAGGDPANWSSRWQVFGTRAAGLRSFETRASGLVLAENEARKLIPRVLEASEKVDRTRFPTLNSLIIAAQRGTGGEDVVKLGIAISALVPVYARVLKPNGVITEGDTSRANHLLADYWSKGQIRAALEQMTTEIDAAKEALIEARKEYNEPAHTTTPPKTEPPPAAAKKLGPQDQQALDWANANPTDKRAAAIKKRLGVD